MSYEIGILLGQYAGSQSFESVGSWDNQITQSSLSIQSTYVHSSALAGELQINSGSTGSLSYDYGKNNDLYDRWYTDITTHSLVVYFWAKVDTAANSGQVSAVFSNDSTPIGYSADFQRYRLETSITSGTSSKLDFKATTGITSSFNCYIDDIVAAVDVVKFNPDWDLQRLRNQNVARHTTLQGRESAYSWGEFREWALRLSHVNDIESSVINGWWRNARNLYVTFNTSDTNDMYIVRLANATNPFTGVQRPYVDHSNAVLSLQTLHYSLDY